MAPKRKAKPPPAKKKRMSLSKRNKASSLSSEYLKRISSSENGDIDGSQSTVPSRKRKTKHKRTQYNESHLNTVWQNPSYKTELSVSKSQSDDSRLATSISVDGVNTEVSESIVPMQSDFVSNLPENDDVDSFVPVPAGKLEKTRVPRILSRKRPHAAPPVDSALVLVHNQLVMLESRFQKDLHELENSYITNYYSPLCKLRNKLLEAAKVLNSVEPKEHHRKHERNNHRTSISKQQPKASAGPFAPSTSAGVANTSHLPSCELFECCAKVFAKTFGEEKWAGLARMLCHISDAMYQTSHCNDCDAKPHKFWFYVFQRSEPMLSGMLNARDVEILTHLRDVRVHLFTAPWPESPDIKSDVRVARKHPPLKTKLPKMSARQSVSLPSHTSKNDVGSTGREAIDPSSRACHRNSETTTNDKSSTDNDTNRALGFEIEFEFYPNEHISNKILRKRYLIDFKPHDDDYIEVKQYKTFMTPQDCTSKVYFCTSDGGDELSTDSENDGPVSKRKKEDKFRKSRIRTKKHRCHRILDYRGPRLVAIEGSTIKWKKRRTDSKKGHDSARWRRPWMASSDLSVKTSSSGESLGALDTSFFDFFGWNWDIYSNRILTNDRTREIELGKDEIRIYITRDYELGSYIRDVVVPRAFAIYRSCKRIGLQTKASSPAESLLDTVSHVESIDKFKASQRVHHAYSVNPAYVISAPTIPPPQSLAPEQVLDVGETPSVVVESPPNGAPEPQSQIEINQARSYDDVDDIMVFPSTTDQTDADQKKDVSTQNVHTGIPAIGGSEIDDSRRKVSELVKNVNTIIHQANEHTAFHQPFVSTEPQPGAPLTCPLDLQLIPDVPESAVCRDTYSSADSDIPSSGLASHKGDQADDENNYRSDGDPPSVNRAFEKIRGQFRRGNWKKVDRDSTKGRIKPRRCLINDEDDDEIVSSVAEKEKKIKFHQGSPCPSDENAKIDESDLLSSSAASDALQESATPSTSEYDVSNPDVCPCDLHLLDEGTTCMKKGRRGTKVDNRHILCENSEDDIPLCSMGRDILKDENLRKEYMKEEMKMKVAEFREVSSSDSEAPPPAPDPSSCKQQ
ncbi:uncharacterized protein LOC120343036 isoform X1 [Styela clava]